MTNTSNKQLITRLKHLREMLANGCESPSTSPPSKTKKRSKSKSSPNSKKGTKTSKSVTKMKSNSPNSKRRIASRNIDPKYEEELLDFRIDLGNRFQDFLKDKNSKYAIQKTTKHKSSTKRSLSTNKSNIPYKRTHKSDNNNDDDVYTNTTTSKTKVISSKRTSTSKMNNREIEKANVQPIYTKTFRSQSTSHNRQSKNEYYVPPPIGKNSTNKNTLISTKTSSKTTQNIVNEVENENNHPNIKQKYTYKDHPSQYLKTSSSTKDNKTSFYKRRNVNVSSESDSNNVNILSNSKYLPKRKVVDDLSQSSSSFDNISKSISAKNYKTPNPEINSKKNEISMNKNPQTVATKLNDDFAKKKSSYANTAKKKIDFSDSDSFDITKYKAKRTSSPIKSTKPKVTTTFSMKQYDDSSNDDNIDNILFRREIVQNPIETISQTTKATKTMTNTKSTKLSSSSSSDNFYLDKKPVTKVTKTTTSISNTVVNSSPLKGKAVYQISSSSDDDLSLNKILERNKKVTSSNTKITKTTVLKTSISSSSSADDLLQANKKMSLQSSNIKNKINISSSGDDIAFQAQKNPQTTTTKPAFKSKINIDSSDDEDIDFSYNQSLSKMRQTIAKASSNHSSQHQELITNISSSSDELNQQVKGQPLSSSHNKNLKLSPVSLDSSETESISNEIKFKKEANLVNDLSSDPDFFLNKKVARPSPTRLNNNIISDESSDTSDLLPKKTSTVNKPASNLQTMRKPLNASDDEDDLNIIKKDIIKSTNIDISDDSNEFGKNIPDPTKMKQVPNYPIPSSSDDDILLNKGKTNAEFSPQKKHELSMSSSSSPVDINPISAKNKKLTNILNAIDDSDTDDFSIPTSNLNKKSSQNPSSSPKKRPLSDLLNSDSDIQPQTKLNGNFSSSSSSPLMNPSNVGSNQKSSSDLLTPPKIVIDKTKSSSNSKKQLNSINDDEDDDSLYIKIDSKLHSSSKKMNNQNILSSEDDLADLKPKKDLINILSSEDDLSSLKSKNNKLNILSSDDDLNQQKQANKQPIDSSSDDLLSPPSMQKSSNLTKKQTISSTSISKTEEFGKSIPVMNKNILDSDSSEEFSALMKPPATVQLSPAKPIPQSQQTGKNKPSMIDNSDTSSPTSTSNIDQSPKRKLKLSPPMGVHSPERKSPKNKREITIQSHDFGSDTSESIIIDLVNKTANQSFKDNQLSPSDEMDKASETEEFINKYPDLKNAKYSDIFDSKINISSNISPDKKSPKKGSNILDVDLDIDSTDIGLPKPKISSNDDHLSSGSDTPEFLKKASKFLDDVDAKNPPLEISESTTEEVAVSKVKLNSSSKNLFESESSSEILPAQKKSFKINNVVKTEENTVTNIFSTKLSSDDDDDSGFSFQPALTKDNKKASTGKGAIHPSDIDIDESTDTETLLNKFTQNDDDRSFEERMKEMGKQMKKETGELDSEEDHNKLLDSSSSSIKINSNFLGNHQFSSSTTDNLVQSPEDQQISSSVEEQMVSIPLNKKGQKSSKKDQIVLLSDEDSADDIMAKINNKTGKGFGILDESNSDEDDDNFNLIKPPQISSETTNTKQKKGNKLTDFVDAMNSLSSDGNKPSSNVFVEEEEEVSDTEHNELISQINQITKQSQNSNNLDVSSSDEEFNLTKPTKSSTVSTKTTITTVVKQQKDNGDEYPNKFTSSSNKSQTEELLTKITNFTNQFDEDSSMMNSKSSKGKPNIFAEEEGSDDDILAKISKNSKKNSKILDENSDDDDSLMKPSNQINFDNSFNSSSSEMNANNKQKQNILNKDEDEDDSDNLIASIAQITKQTQNKKQKQSSSNILDENSSDDEINLQVPKKAPTISSEAERIVLDESLTSSNAKTTKKSNQINFDNSFDSSSSNMDGKLNQKQNILNEDDDDDLIASIAQITNQSQSLKQKQSSSNILDENSSDDEINLQVPNKAPTISSEAERIVLDESLTSSNAKTTKKNNQINFDNSFDSSSSEMNANNKQKQNILNKDEGEDDSDNLIASITQITKQSQSLKQKQSSSNILDENSSDDEINLQVPNKAPTISSEAERIVLDESLSSSNNKSKKQSSQINIGISSEYSSDVKKAIKQNQDVLNKVDDEYDDDDDLISSIVQITKQAQNLKQKQSSILDENSSDDDMNLTKPTKSTTISSEAEKIVLDESLSSISKPKGKNNQNGIGDSFNSSSSPNQMLKPNQNLLSKDEEEDDEDDELLSKIQQSQKQSHNILGDSSSDEDVNLTKPSKAPTISSEAEKIFLDEGSSSAYPKQPTTDDIDDFLNKLTVNSKGKVESEENKVISSVHKTSSQIMEEEEEEIDSLLNSFKAKQNSTQKLSSQKDDSSDDIDIDNIALYNQSSSFSKKPVSNDILNDDDNDDEKDDLLLKIDSVTKSTSSNKKELQISNNSSDDDDDILNKNMFTKIETTITTTTTTTSNAKLDSDEEENILVNKQKPQLETTQKQQIKQNIKAGSDDEDYDDTDSEIKFLMNGSNKREIFRFDDNNSSDGEENETQPKQQKVSQSKVDSIFPKQQNNNIKGKEEDEYDENQNEEEEVFQFENDYTSDLMKKQSHLDNEYEEEEETEKIIKSASTSTSATKIQIIKPKKEEEEEESIPEKLISSVQITQEKKSAKSPYDDFTSDDDLLDYKSGSVEDFNLNFSDNDDDLNLNPSKQTPSTKESIINDNSNTEITNFTINGNGNEEEESRISAPSQKFGNKLSISGDEEEEEESKISSLSQKFSNGINIAGGEEDDSDNELDFLKGKTAQTTTSSQNQTTVTTTISTNSKQTKSFNILGDESDSDIDNLGEDGQNLDDIKTSSSDQDDEELISIKQNHKNIVESLEKRKAAEMQSNDSNQKVDSNSIKSQTTAAAKPSIGNDDLIGDLANFEEEEEELDLDEINMLINGNNNNNSANNLSVKLNNTIDLANEEEDGNDYSGLGFTLSNEMKSQNSLNNEKSDSLNKQIKINKTQGNSINVNEESENEDEEDLLKSSTLIDGGAAENEEEDDENFDMIMKSQSKTKANQLLIIEEEDSDDDIAKDPELQAIKMSFLQQKQQSSQILDEINKSITKSEQKVEDGTAIDFEIQADSDIDVDITIESDSNQEKNEALEKILKESDNLNITPHSDDDDVKETIKNIGIGKEENDDNIQQIMISNDENDDFDLKQFKIDDFEEEEEDNEDAF